MTFSVIVNLVCIVLCYCLNVSLTKYKMKPSFNLKWFLNLYPLSLLRNLLQKLRPNNLLPQIKNIMIARLIQKSLQSSVKLSSEIITHSPLFLLHLPWKASSIFNLLMEAGFLTILLFT